MNQEVNREPADMLVFATRTRQISDSIDMHAEDLRKACTEASPLMRDPSAQLALKGLLEIAAELAGQSVLARELAGRVEKSAKLLDESETY